MVDDTRENERLIQELIRDGETISSIDITFDNGSRQLSVFIRRVGAAPLPLTWTPETLLHVVDRTGIIDAAKLRAALSYRRTGALLISRYCTDPVWKDTSYR